ncbi:MAG TPA: serine/threonine protein kinase, partial [Cyanobacteria bacterium UBA11368]|nr:serine/threonine protein kinase [Cyanobacteria bacterium UBA11368]
QSADKLELAQLNLFAGQRALSSVAYEPALRYANIGIDLLGDTAWQARYDLALALHELAAEVAYLCGNFELMNQLIDDVLQHAKTLLDKVKVYDVKIQSCGAQNNLQEAIDTALSVLKLLDVHFPESSTQADIQSALEETFALWCGKSPASLIELPKMTAAEPLAAIQLLSVILPFAYQIAPNLFILITLKQVDLSLKYGNTGFSSDAYACYGFILCSIVGNIEAGFQFGELSLALLSDLPAQQMRAKPLYVVNAIVNHWKQSIHATLDPLLNSYTIALETGDLPVAGWAAYMYGYHSYFVGQALGELISQLTAYSEQLHRIQQEPLKLMNDICCQAAFNLVYETETPSKLSGNYYDEEALLPQHQKTNNYTLIFKCYLQKLILSYLFGNPSEAVGNANMAEQYLDGVIGYLDIPLFYFYASLALLATLPDGNTEKVNSIQERVAVNQQKMEYWATHAPMNYLQKFHLVEAERCQVLGQRYEAMELYDRAISGAKTNGYIQEEALANELAAKFYLDWGKEKVAAGYMQEAYYCYARWGAKAKIEDLATRYPQLLTPILQRAQIAELSPLTTSVNTLVSLHQTISSTSTSISNLLDLGTVLKAAQALYSEIHLDKLLAAIMKVIVENSGADKAALFLDRDGELEVVIKYLDNAIGYFSPKPVDECKYFPTAVVHYVERTLETLINDAKTHPSIVSDSYFIQHQPQSLLCTPILNQGKLIGVLYLENSLTSGAFTSSRVELLKFLCSQAAISLENARLYQQSQTYAQQLEQSVEKLQFSEARYRYLATATSQIIWLASPEGENLDTVHWMAYTGQTEAEVKGTGWLNALHPDDIEHTTQVWLQAVETKTLYETEYRIRGADGIYRYFAVRGVPLLAEDGSVKEWIGTCNDIDARRRAEDQLRLKSQQLEQTLKELQTMQLQLVQNEKMSALGNLVAGVAHEINNPVGFLKGNISPALDYIKDLFGLIDLYQEKYPEPDADIEDEIETIDLEFVREDLPKLVGSMQEGVERIANISTSLRTFSRADSDTPVAFNLHEGLDSTILILKHRLKANENRPAIKVIKKYGQIPNVECFAGQVNQVFMNILANAIDALEDSNIGRSFAEIQSLQNWIAITTECVENKTAVCIRIKDNGTGMSEEVKQKIFDHLFTTKGVGKGTGLGLAIAHQIVTEKHNGLLEVNSTLGGGSEFIITLPVKTNV